MKHFNTNTDQLLSKLFYNLPLILLISVLAFRLLIAIPITIVAINKFEFIESAALKYILAFGSIVSLEVLLTLLSLLTAYFRRNEFDAWANGVLVLVLVLTGYTSYLIHNVSEMYDNIVYPLSAFLTLHILNIVSIVLSESVGFLLKQDAQAVPEPVMKKLHEKKLNNFPPKLIGIKNSDIALDTKIKKVNNSGFFAKQLEIADFLGTNATKVSRVLKN